MLEKSALRYHSPVSRVHLKMVVLLPHLKGCLILLLPSWMALSCLEPWSLTVHQHYIPLSSLAYFKVFVVSGFVPIS